VLEGCFRAAEAALESRLAEVSVADVIDSVMAVCRQDADLVRVSA
jgi:hypothetical protein